MTNWEHYFGTPEAASHMGVAWYSWPFRIVVCCTGRMSKCTCHHQHIAGFDTEDAFRAWLNAEYDDGTIAFED